jgi:hypothetical protein
VDVDPVAFERDGYAVVPGLVDRERCDRALRLANHWLATGYDLTQKASYDSLTFAPDLTTDPAFLDLYHQSGAAEVAAALVGRPLPMVWGAQIALRFPSAPGTDAPRWSGGHIDGLPAPSNGVPADGRVYGFTLLAGVYLDEVRGPSGGGFTVFPGTHHAMAAWFREHGTAVPDADVVYAECGRLANTVEPVEITGPAGTLVLAHHLLVHKVAFHEQPHVRYAAFFRLSTEHREEFGDAVLTDPWAEWDVIRAVAN